jgi:hypothetical protein
MHRYRLEGVGLHWSRFVHVGHEAEIVYPENGWGRTSRMASLNKMIKQMSSWDESVPLPAHPDARTLAGCFEKLQSAIGGVAGVAGIRACCW